METKKAISKLITNLDSLEQLSGIIKKEVLIAAQVIELADVQQREFKSQNEALRSEHETLTAQISEAKAELERLAAAKEALEAEIKALGQERREHAASLENLRKQFEAA
jgi:chromosome segregation ATPase